MTTLRHQGSATIRINGQEYKTLPGASLTLGGLVKTDVIGFDVYGWKGTPAAAVLTCTIPNHEDISIQDVNNMNDVTLVFETDIGLKYLLSNAWNTSESTLVGEGDFSTTFHAKKAQTI